MRILWINPAGSPGEPFYRYVHENCGEGVVVDVKDFERGPRRIEYLYYEALVVPDVVHEVKRAETEGYDGVVIGCFADPGLYESREVVTDISVAGSMESSLSLAMTLGYRFSIIVGRRKWEPSMYARLQHYGMGARLASFRDVGLGVRDFERDPKLASKRILEASRRAVEEDGAEVVVLGCTGTYGHYRVVQEELGVPVIDPVIAALNHVRALVDLRTRFGWSHSKACQFESPPTDEILEWDLGKAYGFSDFKRVWRSDPRR